jgi:Tfp pilus assembly protein PilZ
VKKRRPKQRHPARPDGPERRSPFRVPFVRRCRIEFSDGRARSVFIANINEFGAYVADDEMPLLGQGVRLLVGIPGSEAEVEVRGAVAWVNPGQQHPVHSLPPGYGVKFDPLHEPALGHVVGVVRAWLARNPPK